MYKLGGIDNDVGEQFIPPAFFHCFIFTPLLHHFRPATSGVAFYHLLSDKLVYFYLLDQRRFLGLILLFRQHAFFEQRVKFF